MTVIVMGVVMSMFVRMHDLLMNMVVRVFLIRILRLKAGWVRVPMVGDRHANADESASPRRAYADEND